MALSHEALWQSGISLSFFIFCDAKIKPPTTESGRGVHKSSMVMIPRTLLYVAPRRIGHGVIIGNKYKNSKTKKNVCAVEFYI
jgi:hypothetical protein